QPVAVSGGDFDLSHPRLFRARRLPRLVAGRGVAVQQIDGGVENFGRRQLPHAPVVERADSLLAWAAGDLLLQVARVGVVLFGPGDVRGRGWRQHWAGERGGDVPGPAGGRDAQ